MSVATYTGANPDCFGSADVTLTGWEDIPSGYGSPEEGSRLEPTWFEEPTAAMLIDAVPGTCGPCEPNLMVHVNPATKLRFEADGVFVVITGHRQDPAANNCYTAFDDQPAPPTQRPGDSKALCVDKFVLTSVREVMPPAGSLVCPTDAVLTVDQYLTTDPACFHRRTLKILAWADDAPPVDFGFQYGVSAAWLVFPQQPYTGLWDVRPIGAAESISCPDGGQDGLGSCRWMFAQVKPGSGVSLTPAKRWVLLTGHIDDPAAAACRWTGVDPADQPPPNDLYARQVCAMSLVVTAVQRTAAPTVAWTPQP